VTRTRAANGTFTHGPSGYTNYGCRCPVCTEGFRVKHLEYMHSHPEQMEKSRRRELARYYSFTPEEMEARRTYDRERYRRST
jgi:hypothetical protein